VPGEAVYPLEYPLDEVLVSNLLARGRGIEIHACGLADADGNGYLFPGQSGAGKSTIARLWAQEVEEEAGAGVRVLSDERVILCLKDGRIWMYGTPWHGDAGLARPDSAPLARIFFLARGSENELTRLHRAESAARLFACSFPPFHSADGIRFTLRFLDDLTELVPCDELRFAPDRRVIQFIRERAGSAPKVELIEDVS
jgi:energy-coupling factor transporter ATP-binding protein EcfA2